MFSYWENMCFLCQKYGYIIGEMWDFSSESRFLHRCVRECSDQHGLVRLSAFRKHSKDSPGAGIYDHWKKCKGRISESRKSRIESDSIFSEAFRTSALNLIDCAAFCIMRKISRGEWNEIDALPFGAKPFRREDFLEYVQEICAHGDELPKVQDAARVVKVAVRPSSVQLPTWWPVFKQILGDDNEDSLSQLTNVIRDFQHEILESKDAQASFLEIMGKVVTNEVDQARQSKILNYYPHVPELFQKRS